MRRTVVVAAAAGLMMAAACSQGGGSGNTAATNGAGGAGQAAKPASGPDIVISAADMPHVKAGYWARVETTNGQGAQVTHSCESGKPVDFGKTPKECSSFALKRTFLGAIVLDGACKSGPVSSTMHVTISGDFDSHYVTDGAATITMEGRPPTSFATHTEAKYLGPCPPGVKPED
ncbi:MAG TPA: hypothetical protein VGG29_13155 [Caulobacteraceae bacterium]|jgi:hypothetical protein